MFQKAADFVTSEIVGHSSLYTLKILLLEKNTKVSFSKK